MPKKSAKYVSQLAVDGVNLPVNLHVERRQTVTFSLRHTGVTVRIPRGMSEGEWAHHADRLRAWVQQVFDKKPALRESFVEKSYQTGDLLTVGERQYRIEIEQSARATSTARLVGDTICLHLSLHADRKTIQTLLSRIVAHDFYPELSRRIHEINRLTVDRPIRSIALKYSHSRWGSCSRTGNINLSTRLLFAPREVQDYVIVHELAHLVEANHSDRFWALVERFSPQYKACEKWLKVHGARCDF
ncbi:MAG: M48 family metallopeptidase [Saprospiraceae bacterium]|nr:M48 family metallopeptidase [Saprospiraceae bacterium]MCC7506078.1 M48 family metallopeptidase [Saprospiraceae bacterium]